MAPWYDRNGRLSPLKLTAFILVVLPGAWIAARWASGAYAPRPLEEAIHQTGLWGIRLLILSLLVTPLRRIAAWQRLIVIRRMIGVAALAYLLIHFALYVADQDVDLAKVASEIWLRIYLTVGFVALAGLAVLGATSTDAMIRRLGKAWPKLHRIVYVLAALGLWHFFMQSKIDVSEPVLMAGFFIVLMGYRGLVAAGIKPAPLVLVGLAVASGLATALVEWGWYALGSGVRAKAVLAANLHFAYSIRPAWWVLLAGLVLALVAVWGSFRTASAGSRRPVGSRRAA